MSAIYRNIVFACECVRVRLCFVCGACIQEHSSMCGWCLLVKPLSFALITFAFTLNVHEPLQWLENDFISTARNKVVSATAIHCCKA